MKYVLYSIRNGGFLVKFRASKNEIVPVTTLDPFFQDMETGDCVVSDTDPDNLLRNLMAVAAWTEHDPCSDSFDFFPMGLREASDMERRLGE